MTSSGSERSSGDLVGALSEDVGRLVRQELRQAQDELTAKAKRAAKAAALLGGAGVLGALAAGTSAAVLVRVLDRFLPPRAAAAVATLCLGAGAAALAALGVTELRRALPLVPEGAVAGLRQDVRAAQQQATANPTPGSTTNPSPNPPPGDQPPAPGDQTPPGVLE